MPESFSDYHFDHAQDAADFGAFCRRMGAKTHRTGSRLKVYRRISVTDHYLAVFRMSTGRAAPAQLEDWYTDEQNP